MAYLRSGAPAVIPAATGKILQCVSTTLTAVISSTTQGWNDIDGTNLAVSITLANSSNKVLVMWTGGIGQHDGWTPTTRVVRDYATATTACVVSTSTGGTSPAGISVTPGYSGGQEEMGDQAAHFLDTPGVAGTAIEYKMQWFGRTDSSGYNYCNRQKGGYTASHYGAGISSLTLWEIGA